MAEVSIDIAKETTVQAAKSGAETVNSNANNIATTVGDINTNVSNADTKVGTANTNASTAANNLSTALSRIGTSSSTSTTTLFGKLNGGGGSIIKSIQRGRASIKNGTLDVTISAVNVNKAMVKFLGSTAGGAIATYYRPTITLFNSTTLRISKGDPSAVSTRVSWEVLEFK